MGGEEGAFLSSEEGFDFCEEVAGLKFFRIPRLHASSLGQKELHEKSSLKNLWWSEREMAGNSLEPTFFVGNIGFDEFFVGFGEVDDSFDEADDCANRATSAK